MENTNITLSYSYAGGGRSTVFDENYGRIPVRPYSPYKLGLEVNGEYLTGSAALTELNKPIWGENGDQKFEDVLPTLTPAVPMFTMGYYPWHDILEVPEEDPPNGYEVMLENGGLVQRLPLESYPYWHLFGATQWRKYAPNPTQQPNPEYPIVEAQRAAERQQYKEILQETFTLMSNLVFPTYLYDLNKTNLKWFWQEEGQERIEIPVDPEHWLAGNGRLKLVMKPLPESYQTGSSQWDGAVSRTILITPADRKVKALLGM